MATNDIIERLATISLSYFFLFFIFNKALFEVLFQEFFTIQVGDFGNEIAKITHID